MKKGRRRRALEIVFGVNSIFQDYSPPLEGTEIDFARRRGITEMRQFDGENAMGNLGRIIITSGERGKCWKILKEVVETCLAYAILFLSFTETF